MRNSLIVFMLALAIPLMACLAVTSLFSSPQNPKYFVGNIAIQGDGVMIMCSDPSYGFTCTGKTTVVVSPSSRDFYLQTNNTGKITSGEIKFTLEINQNYDISAPDSPDCSAKLTGSSTSKYTGSIPLPAIGGPPVASAIFDGSLAENANGQIPWHCPGAGADSSGSIVQAQDNVTFELDGFSSSIVKGKGGKCVFTILDSLSSILTSYNHACVYGIVEVPTQLPTGPTQSL
jgi:hypothetical protein